MADIKATEECLREQSYGKLLSVQRTVIKTDRLGLSVPMSPHLLQSGADHQNDPGGLGSPRHSGRGRVVTETGTSVPKGLLLCIPIPPGPP